MEPVASTPRLFGLDLGSRAHAPPCTTTCLVPRDAGPRPHATRCGRAPPRDPPWVSPGFGATCGDAPRERYRWGCCPAGLRGEGLSVFLGGGRAFWRSAPLGRLTEPAEVKRQPQRRGCGCWSLSLPPSLSVWEGAVRAHGRGGLCRERCSALCQPACLLARARPHDGLSHPFRDTFGRIILCHTPGPTAPVLRPWPAALRQWRPGVGGARCGPRGARDGAAWPWRCLRCLHICFSILGREVAHVAVCRAALPLHGFLLLAAREGIGALRCPVPGVSAAGPPLRCPGRSGGLRHWRPENAAAHPLGVRTSNSAPLASQIRKTQTAKITNLRRRANRHRHTPRRRHDQCCKSPHPTRAILHRDANGVLLCRRSKVCRPRPKQGCSGIVMHLTRSPPGGHRNQRLHAKATL